MRAIEIMAAAALFAIQGQVLAASPGVVKAVGSVSEVWERDSKYAKFHESLQRRFKDIKPLSAFSVEETWVSVLASTAAAHWDVYKGRLAPGVNVGVGDIVEVSVKDSAEAKSYEDLSIVTKVLCVRGSEGFAECASRHPLGAWGQDGQAITRLKLE